MNIDENFQQIVLYIFTYIMDMYCTVKVITSDIFVAELSQFMLGMRRTVEQEIQFF